MHFTQSFVTTLSAAATAVMCNVYCVPQTVHQHRVVYSVDFWRLQLCEAHMLKAVKILLHNYYVGIIGMEYRNKFSFNVLYET